MGRLPENGTSSFNRRVCALKLFVYRTHRRVRLLLVCYSDGLSDSLVPELVALTVLVLHDRTGLLCLTAV